MTFKQKILKTIYPVLMKAGKLLGLKAGVKSNKNFVPPKVSFYELEAYGIKGEKLSFDLFKGKFVLIVNTASDCGYTNQYGELNSLYEMYKEKLVVMGFPSNDFKEQEKHSDEEIASFCSINFGVTFFLAKKSEVLKGNGQNKVFEWLSTSQQNGWNDQQPEWNFAKYLINGEGILINYFGPGVAPLSKVITVNLPS